MVHVKDSSCHCCRAWKGIQQGLIDTKFESCICEENKMARKVASNMNNICVYIQTHYLGVIKILAGTVKSNLSMANIKNKKNMT